MASAKYQRIDNRRSSTNYCSTVTIVVFVALCLVGVWMMTSSSVVPVQNFDASQESKSDQVKEQININESNDQVNESNEATEQVNDKASSQYVDHPVDFSNNATKGAIGDTNSSNEQNQEEKVETKNQEPKDESPGDSNVQENQEQKQDGQIEQNSLEGDSNSQESQEQKQEENAVLKPEKNETSEVDLTSQEGLEQKQEMTDLKFEQKGSSGNDSNSHDKVELKNEKHDVSEEPSKSEDGDSKSENDELNSQTKNDFDKYGGEEKSESADDAETKSENVKGQSLNETKVEEGIEQNEKKSSEVFPSGAQAELLKETTTQNGSFSTQFAEAKHQKESQESEKAKNSYGWKLCNVTAGPDYIPCLDNWEALHHLRTTKHYEHRERHCPKDPPTCLVSLPGGYKRPIDWPRSREKIWYYNVPHTKLAEVKGHQNWVKVNGEYLTFPGGGTQFKHGALHYIDFIQKSVPDIAWGDRSRVVLDVGCGVASFGGFLFDRDVLTMSLAPKDEHEAQVQFALERGIPAISSVMGTIRLPFPGRVFDVVHCARCRVPWHIEGGKLLLELNRLLRPGGFFVWSATPVYQKLGEDVEIWKAMSELTKAMCWELVSVSKDKVNRVGVATYRKPTTNECYDKRAKPEPPLCEDSDDPDAAWNVTLKACMHKIPNNATQRGSQWPPKWPTRLETPPYWLLSSQVGVYGKASPDDFFVDYEHWKKVVRISYLTGIGLDWSNVRNVMDMRAVYGGFAAALRDLNIWVMNVVSINAPDTLPIIYERGLFGIYHDWCESFSTYPRSYDLLHADHLFSQIKKRCNLKPLVVEVDRILRPEGYLIVRDDAEIINELEALFRSMQWEIRLIFAKNKQGLLCVQKSMWRPSEYETVSYAIA